MPTTALERTNVNFINETMNSTTRPFLNKSTLLNGAKVGAPGIGRMRRKGESS